MHTVVSTRSSTLYEYVLCTISTFPSIPLRATVECIVIRLARTSERKLIRQIGDPTVPSSGSTDES